MDTVAGLRTGLSKLTWTQMCKVAAETGIPPHTIRRIATGLTRNPRIDTVEPLQAYLSKQGNGA